MKGKRSISIVPLLLTQYKRILLGLFLMLFVVGMQVVSPWLMKMVIDQAIPQKNHQLLLTLILVLALIPLFITILQSIRNQVTHQIGGCVTDTFRNLLFDKLVKLSPKTYHHFQSGDIAGRIYSCGEIGDAFIAQVMVPAIFDIGMFVGITMVMFYLNAKLTILVLILLPIMYYLSRWLTKKTRPKINKIIQLQQGLQTYATEFTTGLKTVQKFHQEVAEREYQKNWIRDYRKLRNQAAFYDDFSILIVDFGRSLGFGIVFIYAAIQIMQGQMTIGTLIAFSVYFPQLFASIQHIQAAYVMSEGIKPKLELVYQILHLEDEIIDHPSKAQKLKGAITFADVSFSYEKGRGELSHVDFSIEAGEFIGIVGATGSGKSTILDLIMRFYEPTSGAILIDGRDICDYAYGDLRSQIGLVSQDVFLWNKSIQDNLRYAKPSATEEEMLQACEHAQVLDFIQQLPDGWDTIIGERGVKLSGGEKQRLGIAQMVLRNPQIILLDEPTSALDANTEALLQENLTQLFHGKTTVAVAHRLATVRKADRIMVIDNGKLTEMGSHDALMENGAIYQKLYAEQFQVH
ncbi:ABC transporter ATP-binding protein [Shimazuella kribbensis]|uniref:ABC transporter ATP-binding protein n=1 Tax=Shimazuella kribbensis TaxID=139808 RepID=UPI0003F6045F|nr:ABC transporter ATP-binding protein [Shimazuella kribbensis]